MDEELNKLKSKMGTICRQMKLMTDEKELMNKWQETFDFRREQLKSNYFENWKQYFEEYPFCKNFNYALFVRILIFKLLELILKITIYFFLLRLKVMWHIFIQS